jgi:hypothetical protein
VLRKDSKNDVGGGIQRGKVDARDMARGMSGVVVSDGILSMIQICKWFPGIIKGRITTPMNLVKGLPSHSLEIRNVFDIIFEFIIDEDRGRRRMCDGLGRRRGRVIRGQKSFVKDRM